MEARPERVHQLVLGHHPPGVPDEIAEQAEHERLYRERLAPEPERAAGLVELEIAESEPRHASARKIRTLRAKIHES